MVESPLTLWSDVHCAPRRTRCARDAPRTLAHSRAFVRTNGSRSGCDCANTNMFGCPRGSFEPLLQRTTRFIRFLHAFYCRCTLLKAIWDFAQAKWIKKMPVTAKTQHLQYPA